MLVNKTISSGDAYRIRTIVSLAMQDMMKTSFDERSDEMWRDERAKQAAGRICATLGITVV